MPFLTSYRILWISNFLCLNTCEQSTNKFIHMEPNVQGLMCLEKFWLFRSMLSWVNLSQLALLIMMCTVNEDFIAQMWALMEVIGQRRCWQPGGRPSRSWSCAWTPLISPVLLSSSSCSVFLPSTPKVSFSAWLGLHLSNAWPMALAQSVTPCQLAPACF